MIPSIWDQKREASLQSMQQEGLNDLWIFKQEDGDYSKEGDFTYSNGFDKYHRTAFELDVSIFKGLLKKYHRGGKNY